MVKVSIVIPTKNSASMLKKCLESIQNLDFPKNEYEVIIVDGYSTDETVEIAKKYGCKIMFESKGTAGYAKDLGVKHAEGEFVAFTDADCIVDRSWLNELIKHFNNEKVASVGGPNLTPKDDKEFAKCVGATLSLLSKVGARYGLETGEVKEIRHNSGCNVIYKKKVIEEVGGINSNLIYADDEELDYRIRSAGYKIIYTPYAIVYHYRRPTWRKFIRMAWNYGIGKIQAIKMHRKIARWFHWANIGTILIIPTFLMLSVFERSFLLLALLILLTGSVGVGLLSLYLGIRTKVEYLLTYFFLIVTWFLGYGLGMLYGLVKSKS